MGVLEYFVRNQTRTRNLRILPMVMVWLNMCTVRLGLELKSKFRSNGKGLRQNYPCHYSAFWANPFDVGRSIWGRILE